MTPTVLVELRHARYFCAVADETALRARRHAAGAVAAVTERADQLEVHIGARLFDRRSRRVRFLQTTGCFQQPPDQVH